MLVQMELFRRLCVCGTIDVLRLTLYNTMPSLLCAMIGKHHRRRDPDRGE